jgi:hypothetical protein
VRDIITTPVFCVRILRDLEMEAGIEMQRKLIKVIAGIILAVMVMAPLAGCGKSEPAEPSVEPEYAGAIAEGILQAFNTGDYAAFSEHFDPAMKKAMPKSVFKQQADLLQGKIGSYISKTYTRTETSDIYTAVFYKAEFSGESGVTVKVVFLETEDEVFVSGLWFSSPKLSS